MLHRQVTRAQFTDFVTGKTVHSVLIKYVIPRRSDDDLDVYYEVI